MEDIKIMEKPDWISWDDIHELLLEAHKKNIEKGIINAYPQMPGEKIKEKLGEEGKCWVALDGNKLVGTNSVTFFQGKSWWDNGQKVAHGCFTGILQKYQGIGILEEFKQLSCEYIVEKGVYISEGDIAEENNIMRKVSKKNGSKEVSFYAPSSNHYNVRVAKWLNGCPFSDKKINRRFKIAKYLTKTQFKPGGVRCNYILFRACGLIKRIMKIR